jgi:hypothetical protein
MEQVAMAKQLEAEAQALKAKAMKEYENWYNQLHLKSQAEQDKIMNEHRLFEAKALQERQRLDAERIHASEQIRLLNEEAKRETERIQKENEEAASRLRLMAQQNQDELLKLQNEHQRLLGEDHKLQNDKRILLEQTQRLKESSESERIDMAANNLLMAEQIKAEETRLRLIAQKNHADEQNLLNEKRRLAQEAEKLREEERRLNSQRQLALANSDQLALQEQERKEERRLKKQQRSLSNIPTSNFGVDNEEDQFFGLRNRKKNTVLPVLNINGKREINSPSDWIPVQDDHTHFLWSKDNNGITEIPYQEDEDSGIGNIVSNALGTAYKFIKSPSWNGEAKAPTANLTAMNYMVEEDDEDM